MGIIIIYIIVGTLISILINISLWMVYRPKLDSQEVLVTILIWPVVIKKFIKIS